LRNGHEQQVHPALGETPNTPAGQGGGSSQNSNGGKLGISIEPLTPDIASQLGIPSSTRGVVVAGVDPSGPAADAGLEAGDVIQQINRQPIRSPADIQPALAKGSPGSALLLVKRGGQAFFVVVNTAG